MVLTYKCPSCASFLTYDIKSGKMGCASCGMTEPLERAEAENKILPAPDQTPYSCPSCGGPIEAGSHGASMKCSYCSSPVILTPRITGEYAPSCLIPFSFGPDEAAAIYRKWCRHGLVTPSAMLKEEQIGKLLSEYVPFWMYDAQTNTKMTAMCTRTRVYRLGNDEYTEISHFAAERDMDLSFNRLPADASIRMDDRLMDLLEPYDFSGISGFRMPMLSGFFAERYNVSSADLSGRICSRIDTYCRDHVRAQITGYGTVNISSCAVDIKDLRAAFALLPVFTLNYNYKGKDYLFAMNGQTGKISGSPPISRFKVSLWLAGLTGAIYGLIRLVSLFI